MKKKSLVIFLLVMSSLITHAQVITVENIWKEYQFAPRGVRGYTSLPDGEHYATLGASGLDSYSFKTGEKTTTLLDADALKKAKPNALVLKDIDDFSFSQDGSKILIATQLESIYRRSSKAFYYVYDAKDKSITQLSDNTSDKQSFASFSHDGNKVAFVRANNIFYKDLVRNIEVQVTKDGKINHILNGMADWVYEEELDMAQCFSWSPNDTKIAYLHFDESEVKEFSMAEYGDLYPTEYRYKYPKAGEDNSKVEVHLFDCTNQTDLTVDITCEDCYLPRIYWQANATDLIILKLNRHQNKLDFICYNITDKTQQVVFTDENEKWLDVSNDYHFLDDNKTLFLCSERSGFNHIYKVTLGGATTQITSGNWEVAELCAVDKTKKLIYYLSNESGQLNRDLYVIDYAGKNKKLLTSGDGWNSANFSEKAHYFLNSYSNLNTPPVYSLKESNGKALRVLENNETLRKKMKLYPFASREFFTFTTSENIQLNGWMMKPEDYDATHKYPVLMFVYGGPGSQEVQNSYRGAYDIAWYQLLSQKGYIIACVDGRGTAGRGDAFKKCIYQQMGKFEAIDQIEAAKYLKTLPFIDSTRIGIWGWSFGGYLSALTKFTSGNLFKMAMSVAPVTNWRYYDNIYTERFQRTPQENPAGYDDNSPITYAAQLQGKYLLVHGTADDNVHFQNSMDLVNALILGDKQFEQFFYPNKNHFIMGGNTRCHLYNKLTNFVLENL